MDNSKSITEEFFEKIKDLPTIDEAAIDEFDKRQAKVLKRYSQVCYTEIHCLYTSIIQWLKPRLIRLISAWEKTVNLQHPTHKQEYEEIIELISLSEYILETKWDDEFEDIRPPRTEDFFDRLIKQENGNYLLKPYPPKEQKLWRAYYKAQNRKEKEVKDKFTKLLTKNFWKLWV
ncbi:MAG: hypothetical protein FWB72_04285 [Firmicutes bacterium]|nr:hypothetical protein [Bacillota bacterium]